MNIYKITYTIGDPTCDPDYTEIIERSEAAARKRFKVFSKAGTITDVELIRENVSATKEQERETLERIKAMVAELGPSSYLATAFEGTFEDAEQNIEFDAAFSMKARLESAKERFEDMESSFNIAKSDTARLKEQLAAAQEELEALRGKQLSEALRRDLLEMLTAEAQASRARMAEAADKMAVCAENPGCVLFKDSVARYRTEKARAEAMEQRAAELDAMGPKNN